MNIVSPTAASGLPHAPAGQLSGMGVDPETGDPWVFFGQCNIGSCNWYSAAFDLADKQWKGVGAPRDSIPGGPVSPAAPYDARKRAFILRGGLPPRGCFDLPDASDGEQMKYRPLHSIWTLSIRKATPGGWERCGAANAAGSAAAIRSLILSRWRVRGGRRGERFPLVFRSGSANMEPPAPPARAVAARYDAAGTYCPCMARCS